MAYKVKFKSYIADLYIPEKLSEKIVVLVPGLPKSSNVDKLVSTFLENGCVVLYPNFSGTFDSGGNFDGKQSILDISNFIEWAGEPEFTELYFNKKISIGLNNKIILAGMSFGALPSLLGVNDKVDRLILLSPALIFKQSEVSEIITFDFSSQMDALLNLLEKAYSFTYRVSSYETLKQFLMGDIGYLAKDNIQKKLSDLKIKTLVVHGKIDTSIPWQISKELKKNSKNKYITWKFPNVGHSNSSYKKSVLKDIGMFIVDNKKEIKPDDLIS